MKFLESKIPPPFVAILFAGLMWILKQVTSVLTLNNKFHVIMAVVIALFGFFIEVVGVLSFFKARTTADPTHPNHASALVTTGIYRITRNPMYLGDLLMLVGWAVYLSNPLTLLITPLFVLYINRFQIRAEESAMQELFGSQYTDYKSRVRRWL